MSAPTRTLSCHVHWLATSHHRLCSSSPHTAQFARRASVSYTGVGDHDRGGGLRACAGTCLDRSLRKMPNACVAARCLSRMMAPNDARVWQSMCASRRDASANSLRQMPHAWVRGVSSAPNDTSRKRGDSNPSVIQYVSWSSHLCAMRTSYGRGSRPIHVSSMPSCSTRSPKGSWYLMVASSRHKNGKTCWGATMSVAQSNAPTTSSTARVASHSAQRVMSAALFHRETWLTSVFMAVEQRQKSSGVWMQRWMTSSLDAMFVWPASR